MSEIIIESALTGKLEWDLISKWLNNESIESANEDCILLCTDRSEFVAYFLSYLRNQTDSLLQTNSNDYKKKNLPILQHQSTPEKTFGRNHHRSVSDPTCDNDKSNDSLTVKSEKKTHESPNRDRRKQGKRVKTRLFPEEKKENVSLSSDESRLSLGIDQIVISSTPIKNGFKDYPNLPASPVTPQNRSFKEFERCDTPRLNRHSRSSDKSVSLADYLVNVQPKSSRKKRSKNTSNDDSETKVDLDLSNSESFPEIGARKSSSLKSERRRIKPTNIDRSKKSYSLNSFTPEVFQQPSLALEENLAFKPKPQSETSNSLEIERNILKQDKLKLAEKFNTLNTAVTPKPTPQIKILQRENKTQKYIDADVNKVIFIDKIDVLINIYDILLKNNLILSSNTEIYYLITILLSKQWEDDCINLESQFKSDLRGNILRIIHNSTYFAVKSLWNQRTVLEVILDKNSLKILGENKKIRSFYPDLAKFLLNSYGLKCEAETNGERKNIDRLSNGIVCFNHETDNAENFPSVLSFQNFKKQRDMFYEILRWYQDNHTILSRSTLRARIKSLLSSGSSACNFAHLSTLFTHMLMETLPYNEQESKLSKLQRRLTCPSATESHRLPHFSDKEMFYKEFIMYAENESFRVHLRDALASEIITLDSTPIQNESSNGTDMSKEFLQLSRKLAILSKFLGYLTSLPYAQTSIDILLKSNITDTKNHEELFKTPNEKVLENNLVLRDYSQPIIDIKGLLKASIDNNKILITLPWIIHYLSMLDYTTLRLKYYQNILKIIFRIYKKLKINNTDNKKTTIIYLKSILEWLFDLPHFPQELFYEKRNIDVVISIGSIDSIVDESILFELCPFLRDFSVLLTTSRVNKKETLSFRHITPVSLSLNNEDRIRNKEKELQLRLEEEFIKSQPSSTRKVLELVTERVSSSIVKEFALTLSAARRRVRVCAAELVAADRKKSRLLPALHALYAAHAGALAAEAASAGAARASARVAAALPALLPGAPGPLRAVAERAVARRLDKWLGDHWVASGTAILCKNIEEEMDTLLAVGDASPPHVPQLPLDSEFDQMESPAHAIIALKEQICLLLEDQDISPIETLKSCANICSPNNVFTRPPALRAVLQLSVDFAIVFISKKTTKISNMLSHLHTIWNSCCSDRLPTAVQDLKTEVEEGRQEQPHDDDHDGRAPTPDSDEDGKAITIEYQKPEPKPEKPEKSEKSDSSRLLQYFDRILCPRNILILNESKENPVEVWEGLAIFIVFLLKNHYLSEDSLTEQCLAVYRQDWSQNILENLSTCMKLVSSKCLNSSTGKFNLFLDFLADYCNDMDYDLVE